MSLVRFLGEGRWLFWILLGVSLILVPVLYGVKGAWSDWVVARQLHVKVVADEEALRRGVSRDLQLTRALLLAVERRLVGVPNNQQYLHLRAVLLVELDQLAEAVEGYRVLLAVEESAVVMAELVQLLHFLAGGKFTDEAMVLLDRALLLEVDNLLVLELQGLRYFDQGHYRQAIGFWQRALSGVERDSVKARYLLGAIERAVGLLGEAENGGRGG